MLYVRNIHIISNMINAPTKTAKLIRERIEEFPAGEPFTPSAFLELGTRASIDQTLSRLAKTGRITRVARGIFVHPKENRFVGTIMPEPLKVAETIAKATGAAVQIHGAEAARRLELTTQVPMQSVFHTSGPNKRIRVGNLEIKLQHVCPRKLTLAGRPAGQALAALWYLGKRGVTENVITKIRSKLSPSEFEALMGAKSSMPAWMADVFFRHERASHRA